MDYQYILLEKHGPIGRITLNRPDRLNALIPQVGVEFLDAMGNLEADENIRVVVVTGAGRSFCAGDDMKADEVALTVAYRGPDHSKDYVYGAGRWTQMVAAMQHCPKPVIGMIRGHAWGAGINLALGCDLRVCSEDATFCTPFILRGQATGCNLLHYYAGLGVAMRMALLGEPMTAQEALQWGIAYKVVQGDKLEEATLELATRVAALPTRSLGLSKHAIYRGWFRDAMAAYEQQGLAQTLNRYTEDLEEGRRAFIEKRPPRFKGK
ncbi:MAG: enoyl-CoA hydratase/isomerase family protein [Chloroflexota bacterium]|nr:enoyl-CoA hydratase/isomerase family protein [Chloroflexota bacterium]